MMPRISAQTSGPADGLPQPEELVVRPKRRGTVDGLPRISTILGVIAVVVDVLDVLPEPVSDTLVMAPLLATALMILASPNNNRYFAYNRVTRTIVARDRFWGRWRTYPRQGFTRFEYSRTDKELFEVRDDGTKSKLHINPKQAKRVDWEAFMVRFRRDLSLGPAQAQSGRSAEPIPPQTTLQYPIANSRPRG